MKFTVVFNSHESYDLSYGLVFTPIPAWVQGEREIINLNYNSPNSNYKIGSIRKLLNLEKIEPLLIGKDCIVIVHDTGNGSEEDLLLLKSDLEGEGFCVNIVNIN